MNHKGTGLGLSICKNLIQEMGGEVSVESILGEGTHFKITLQMKVIDMNVYDLTDQEQTPKNMKLLNSISSINYSTEFDSKFKPVESVSINNDHVE